MAETVLEALDRALRLIAALEARVSYLEGRPNGTGKWEPQIDTPPAAFADHLPPRS